MLNYFSHIVAQFTLDEREGRIGFKDNYPHPANRDMADSVAAAVCLRLEGKCPDNFYSSQFDDEEMPAGLEPCPIFEYFGVAVDN